MSAISAFVGKIDEANADFDLISFEICVCFMYICMYVFAFLIELHSNTAVLFVQI